MSLAGMFSWSPLVSLRLAELAPHSVLAPGTPVGSKGEESRSGSNISAAEKRPGFRRARKMLLRALIIAVLVRTFVGETSVVPTPSMEGTILVGDHLFWSKALYGPEIPLTHWRLPRLRKVRRGDIVAFRSPRDREQMFLKRVAAVGGDMVEIRAGALYINGAPVEESYAVHQGGPSWSHPWETMRSRIVPAGQIFVLGDNRDNSSDSRDWGPVPEENVIGAPVFVFWSYDAPSAAWLDQAPTHRLEFYTSVAAHFFSRTRWSRLGTVL